MLVSRDLHRKYRSFRLGYLWSILEPLGMAVTMWFVFDILLGGRKLGESPYFMFLVVAILPWWWFTKGISSATRVFRGRTAPLRVSVLPTQTMVMRRLLVSTADFVLSLPIVVAAMIVTWTFPGPLIVFYPVAMVVQFVFMYGLSLLVGAISAVIPDFARIVRILLRAAFYLTPVLYAISNIPAGARMIAPFNPLVGILGLYRIGWWPTESESASAYLISLVVCVVLFAAGVLTFRRLEPRILKEA